MDLVVVVVVAQLVLEEVVALEVAVVVVEDIIASVDFVVLGMVEMGAELSVQVLMERVPVTLGQAEEVAVVDTEPLEVVVMQEIMPRVCLVQMVLSVLLKLLGMVEMEDLVEVAVEVVEVAEAEAVEVAVVLMVAQIYQNFI
jgi:hypothetical protein